jgi:hypothetical protein
VSYRPCQAGAGAARQLFRFAGAWLPPGESPAIAWEGAVDDRVIGAVVVECSGPEGFVHGPVVVDPPPSAEPLEVAAQLVAAVLGHARAHPLNTLFARPQGLDRVWVRLGFVPVPEATLPAGLRERPGSGLYAWRRPGTYQIALPDPEGGRRRRGR